MGKPWALDTFEKLHEAGYRYVEPAPCASPKCDKIVFWFLTPKGHMMPMSKLIDGRYQPHFADCPDARNFSRKATGEVHERREHLPEPAKKGAA